MNNRKFFGYGISASALLLALTGCFTPTITADYIMPPEAISDINAIDTMEIVVNVDMANKEDAAVAKGIICEKIAAGFANEGFFRTTDLIWGNPDGASQMHAMMQAKDSKHGYARITTAPVKPRARMEINFQANVRSSERDLDVKTKLEKVYYRKTYRSQEISWGSGENRRRETIRVPESKPYKTETSVASSIVRQYTVMATGSMNVKVIDKNGKTVYQKSFNKLQASANCDHNSMQALPDNSSLISLMSNEPVATIVKELSPHKESNEVKINKDGDERGFLLLHALAFSEAYDTFENIDEKERTFADWENFGLVCEVLGNYEDAKACFEKAIEVKKADKGLFDYDKNIAEDGINRINKVIKAQEKLDKIK